MCPVVRIPNHVYARLEKHAVGFDTPANVIERILDHYEGSNDRPEAPVQREINETLATNGKRDTTKYLFMGSKYGKGRLVLAVITDYVAAHPGASSHDLQAQFPKPLQGPSGVFRTEAEAREILDRTNHKRHFLEKNELIRLSDCTVAISTEWGLGNISNFVAKARSLGYEIDEVRC